MLVKIQLSNNKINSPPPPPRSTFSPLLDRGEGKKGEVGGGGQEGGGVPAGTCLPQGTPPHAGRITLLIPKFYQLIIKKDNFNNSVAFVGLGY